MKQLIRLLIVAVLGVSSGAFFGATKARADLLCRLIFEGQPSARTTHAQLNDAIHDFRDTPKTERALLREPFFTTHTQQMIAKNTDYVNKRFALFPYDRAVKDFSKKFMARLDAQMAQEVMQHGDLSLSSMNFISAALARLNTLLLNPHEFVRDASEWGSDRRIETELSHSRSLFLNGENHRNLLMRVPFATDVSSEEITLLMIEGVHVAGVMQKNKRADGTDYDPESFYAHDSNHDQLWLEAIDAVLKVLEPQLHSEFPDYDSSPAYQRLMSRLRMIATELQKLPSFERKAGFTTLSYLLHEVRDVEFLKNLAVAHISHREFHMRPDLKIDLIKRLGDKDDMAGELPSSVNHENAPARMDFIHAGETALAQIILHLP